MTDTETKPDWVQYNPLTATYDTPDGTSVASELTDTVRCFADVLNIAILRDEQRSKRATEGKPT